MEALAPFVIWELVAGIVMLHVFNVRRERQWVKAREVALHTAARRLRGEQTSSSSAPKDASGEPQLIIVAGCVVLFRAISLRRVHLQLAVEENKAVVVELYTRYPWVLQRGDLAAVVGLPDPKRGIFVADSYCNVSQNVLDVPVAPKLWPWVAVLVVLLDCLPAVILS